MSTELFPRWLVSVAAPENSIALGSEPRTEVDSQPISPLARPAVSQTETHRLCFYVRGRRGPKHWGDLSPQASSGRTVMRLTAVCMFGRSNPGPANMAPPPPPTVGRPGFEPPTEIFASAALPFNRRWCDSDMPPRWLEPSERKLLTPPPPTPTPTPPPPLKKVISSFRG